MVWLLAATGLRATGGSIETLDGRKLSGDITFAGEGIKIGTNVVALTNLLSADFLADTDDDKTSGGKGTGLLGFYFSGTNFDGASLVRIDEGIDFDWPAGEALPGFLTERFSVVWSGEVEPPSSGEYRFHIATSGTTALDIDGRKVWASTGATAATPRASEPVRMTAGRRHALKLSLAASGATQARLTWSGPGFSERAIPRSRLHPTNAIPPYTSTATGSAGLLGTYYRGAGFSGTGISRVDESVNFTWTDRDPLPGLSRTNLSVRWTGRVRPEHTEEYTFHVTTDERVRLWVDDKLLVQRTEQLWLSESKGSIGLIAGEPVSIRLEMTSQNGDAIARLAWSSASTAKTNIPAGNLSPAWPSPNLLSEERIPAGVLFRNGTFIAAPIERGNDTSVRIAGRLKGITVTTPNIARLYFHSVHRTAEERVPRGQSGVLLARGEFVEGDFRGFDGRRVRMDSVLFGSRNHEVRKEALAVTLRDASTNRAPFQLTLRDRSSIRADSLRIEPGNIVARDTHAGLIRATANEVRTIRRRQ